MNTLNRYGLARVGSLVVMHSKSITQQIVAGMMWLSVRCFGETFTEVL